MKHYILFFIFILTTPLTQAQLKFDQYKKSNTSIVYPNPASSYFTITFNNPSRVVNVSLYSIIGNEIFNKRVDGRDKINFNIQNLQRGKYIVRILNNDGSSDTKSLLKL